MHTCEHAHAHTYAHRRTCTHTFAHTRTRRCTCAHAHTLLGCWGGLVDGTSCSSCRETTLRASPCGAHAARGSGRRAATCRRRRLHATPHGPRHPGSASLPRGPPLHHRPGPQSARRRPLAVALPQREGRRPTGLQGAPRHCHRHRQRRVLGHSPEVSEATNDAHKAPRSSRPGPPCTAPTNTHTRLAASVLTQGDRPDPPRTTRPQRSPSSGDVPGDQTQATGGASPGA